LDSLAHHCGQSGSKKLLALCDVGRPIDVLHPPPPTTRRDSVCVSQAEFRSFALRCGHALPTEPKLRCAEGPSWTVQFFVCAERPREEALFLLDHLLRELPLNLSPELGDVGAGPKAPSRSPSAPPRSPSSGRIAPRSTSGRTAGRTSGSRSLRKSRLFSRPAGRGEPFVSDLA
jgi:hypothetical protein